jgi:hypothetical protein
MFWDFLLACRPAAYQAAGDKTLSRRPPTLAGRRESGERDLFRSRMDQIIDTEHALVKLARTIDWGFLEAKFGTVHNDGAGQPPLPTRLMAGLAIIKHTYNLSDELVRELWIENPYYHLRRGVFYASVATRSLLDDPLA